jgi:hypothetical protein
VPQAVRTHVRRARNRTDRIVHDGADDPLIDPSAACTQKQRRRRTGTHKRRAPCVEPTEQGSLCRHPVGNYALLGTLAEYPDEAALLVDIAEVEPAELGDAYPGGVQQLHSSVITQRKWVRLSGAALRGVQCGCGLFRMQYRG